MIKALEILRNAMRRTFIYVHCISKDYFLFRGTILARGIAFSILVTIVPTLFIALYIGSLIFIKSPEITLMDGMNC